MPFVLLRRLAPAAMIPRCVIGLIAVACAMGTPRGEAADSRTAKGEAASDWPAFRGPQGDGVARRADPQQIPLTWSPSKNVRWRSELPGQGWSSPVVAEGRVYLSAAVPAEGEDYDLVLLMVDAESGTIEKQVTLIEQRAATSPAIHLKNSHASPTPIVTDDRVYVHFGHQGTACTTRDGQLVWVNRELSFPPTHGNGGSPILVDQRLIFTCDGGESPSIAALNAADGSLAWRTPRQVEAGKKTFSFCTPTPIEVDGRTQVIAPGTDSVLALDPRDGHVLWKVRYDGYSVVPKPIFAQGLVILSTGFGRTKLLAIRPDGHGDVTDSHVVWESDRGIPKTPSPVADQGRVFIVSDDGIATALDARSGSVHWKQRLGGNFSASPLLVGDRVYFTDESGVTTVVRADEEYEKLAENDLGERTLASMAVADGALWMRTAEALYRIEQ